MSTVIARSPVRAEQPVRQTSGPIALIHLAERPGFVALVLASVAGLLFFYGLTVGELYRTESLRAIIAAEFLRTGNWIVPTLYGEPLLTKPLGTYAAIALVSWPLGGVSEWTARLPSVLAATVAMLLFYWYFRRQLGNLGGLTAAVILPMSLMWLDKATTAEIDMMQVAWVTGAVLCFLRALDIEEERDRRKKEEGTKVEAFRAKETTEGYVIHPLESHVQVPLSSSWPWWLGSLLCVAGGVLTKWTAPAFFYATVVTLLWWRGRLRLLWSRKHLISAAVGAAVCFAWIGAVVGQVGWHTFYDTVSREGLMRVSPQHHHRPYPWRETLVHPLRLWVASLPASALVLVTLWPGFARLWDERGRRLLQALHCWTWPNLLFWSIIPEHASRHSFPLFPGFAGLTAMVFVAWLTGRLRFPWPRLGPVRALVGVLAVWLVVKILFVEVVTPARGQTRQPRAKAELLASHVPEGKTLYLFMVKDEGIMFYFGRPVLRLPGPQQLPSSTEPLYCIVDEKEWKHWKVSRPTEAILHMQDEQGDPMVVVRVGE